MSAVQLVNDDSVNRTKSYIKPTDSDYVKLAKQGGERDLLVVHEVSKSSQPKPYEKCEWFDHIHNDEEDAKNRKTSKQTDVEKFRDAQEVGNSVSARQEGSMIKEKYTTGGVPFHTDNMSVWERRKQAPDTPEDRVQRRARNPIF